MTVALQLVRFVAVVSGPIGASFLLLGKGIKWLLKKLLLKPALFFYFRLLKLQRAIVNGHLGSNSKYLYWIRRFSYPATVIIIVLFAAGNNLAARDLVRSDFDTPTRLAQIIAPPEEEFTTYSTEGAGTQQAPAVTSYLEEQGALDNPISSSPFGDNDTDSFLSITQGDTALEAPSINDIESLPTARTSILVYTVQSGDTISEIAQKYNISTNTILWTNNLSIRSALKPGQKLSILPTSGLSYTVKSGDSLAAIAKKYQAEVDKIIAFNKLASEKDIRAGEILVIPSGIMPATVVAKPYQPPSTASVFKNIIGAPVNQDSDTTLLWPIGSHRITQYFSWRHTGVDIGTSVGQPIYAAENGRVIASGWNRSGYGYYIIIDHGNGMQTLYAHNSALLVKEGQSVSRGQQISEAGSTGRSTGPHLHFEVRIGGRRTNPLNYIQ
ncbi:MAG: M23 family metallopeptidase [Candidatus Komeilibacteria bacterium]